MVDGADGVITRLATASVAASTEAAYASVAMTRFREFMKAMRLTPHLLNYGNTVTGRIIECFAVWMRERTVLDTNLSPPRRRPVTGTYINSAISGVVSWVAARNPDVAAHLRTFRLSKIIDAFNREDIATRGPDDAHCAIPLSCEFLTRVLAAIDARFANDPRSRTRYRALAIGEFVFGARVFELIDKDRSLAPQLSPSTDRPVLNHAALWRDLQLRVHLADGSQRWATPQEAATTYASCRVSVITLYHDHTKNKPKGTQPMSVWYNTRGPDAPFCAVDAFTTYARTFGALADPAAKLFAGATAGVLRNAVKAVAQASGLPPARAHIRGFRSGCCTATSPDALSDPDAAVARVQQLYQGWAEGGQRPYAKGLMGLGQLKSVDLYDVTINPIADLVARYTRHQAV